MMLIVITFQMHNVAGAARDNDNSGLKNNIGFLIADDLKSVLPASKSKSDRGFNNDDTGRLLCPVTLDWEDPV